MASITVTGTDLVLAGRDGESLTQSFRRAGLAMRDGCRSGGCGVCKVVVVSGSTTLSRTVSEQALPAADRAQGVTLACRAVPDGDVAITVPPDGKLRCIAPMLTALALAPRPDQLPADPGRPTGPGSGLPDRVAPSTQSSPPARTTA